MGRPASAERRRYWQGVLARQRKSGQSVQAFCLANDISQASFYQWRQKLSEHDSAAVKQNRKADLGPFVPLTIPLLPALGSVIEVLHPRGHVLRIPPTFDAESLLRILQVLDQQEA